VRALRGAGRNSTRRRLRPDFPAAAADAEATERSITAPETEIGYYLKDSLLLEDVLREQVLLSCRSEHCASPTAKDFVSAAVQTVTVRPARAMRVRATPLEALSGLRSRIKS